MRIRSRWLVPVVQVLLLAACAAARPVGAPRLESAEALEISRLEDARLLGAGRIEELSRAAAPAVRQRALLALARIGAPETLSAVALALADPEPQVRESAAFALGQFGLAWEPVPEAVRDQAEQALLGRLQSEPEADVRRAAVEALGKIGGNAALAALVAELRGALQDRAAIALGLLAKSSGGKVVSPAAEELLVPMLESGREEVRFGAAYALMRMHRPSSRPALTGCLADASPFVRAVCARGLGEAGAVPEEASKLASMLSDADERVAAEAGRALAKLAKGCGPEACPALAELAKSQAPWRPAVMAAITFEELTDPRAAELFERQLQACAQAAVPLSPGLAKLTLARSHCRAALAHDRAAARLSHVPSCGLGLVGESQRAELSAQALSESAGDPHVRSAALLALLGPGAPAPVRAAVARGLGRVDCEGTRAALQELLRDPDPLVAAAAAESVETLKVRTAGTALIALLSTAKGAGAEDALQGALSALAALGDRAALPAAARLLDHADPGVRRAAVKTVKALGGPDGSAALAPWSPGPYSAERLPGRTVVRIGTTRGPIRLLLYQHDSPLTVQNFVQLVRKGFYRGLTFHRVVPNFVVQGGDPRGDGSGGPGYTLRCEPSARRYVEGSLGMALSGKDTGGSQFFITLSPQPHLDGRYTNFGEVLDGFDAVRQLVEGDTILDASVE